MTWWIAPDHPKINKVFDIYIKEAEKQRRIKICQNRQAEMDACVRERTPNYEYLTTAHQRKIFEPLMPYRTLDRRQPMRHYSDYLEAKAYHESN